MRIRNFAYFDMVNRAAQLRVCRCQSDGSHQVAFVWDRTLSRRGTQSNTYGAYAFPGLDSTLYGRADARGTRVYIQSYTELLTCTLRGVADGVLNTGVSTLSAFFVVMPYPWWMPELALFAKCVYTSRDQCQNL